MTKTGAAKIAARKAGVSFRVYLRERALGRKRCCSCKTWKPEAEFGQNKARSDGLAVACKPCRKKKK